MDAVNFLPLGSIVSVKGNPKKILIIARGLATDIKGKTYYFDYGGCTYPEGLIGDAVAYFNHRDIEKLFFNGFSDTENLQMVNHINAVLSKSSYERGNPMKLNEK